MAVAAWLLTMGAGATAVQAASPEALMRLLDSRQCSRCKLADADLVNADLRDADLRGAELQRANLGQARLDGARLQGADLSFTSLRGASLRGADLRGARLLGTDLREADLGGALLDPGALKVSHWERAQGLMPEQLSYAELHNAGVEAAQAGRHPEAEHYFSEAIRRQPAAAISWVARGLSRTELGQKELAAQDFHYAASLYERAGELEQSRQLQDTADRLNDPEKPAGKAGNGLGSQLLGGALGVMQMLAPLAAKALIPLPF